MTQAKRYCIAIVAVAITLLASPRLHAWSDMPAAMYRDGQHDFDFAFGRWKTHISRLVSPLSGSTTWAEYDGTHVIRKIWNGRANVGELEVDGPSGHIEAVSPRFYNPESHQWRVYYGNPHDADLGPPVTGEFDAQGRGEFYGEARAEGRAVLVREIYTPIDPTTRRLEIAYSADGGKHWEINWKMTDTRIASAGETP